MTTTHLNQLPPVNVNTPPGYLERLKHNIPDSRTSSIQRARLAIEQAIEHLDSNRKDRCRTELTSAMMELMRCGEA